MLGLGAASAAALLLAANTPSSAAPKELLSVPAYAPDRLGSSDVMIKGPRAVPVISLYGGHHWGGVGSEGYGTKEWDNTVRNVYSLCPFRHHATICCYYINHYYLFYYRLPSVSDVVADGLNGRCVSLFAATGLECALPSARRRFDGLREHGAIHVAQGPARQRRVHVR
jgi:hypothetical protein